ncbi:MAG: sigma-70 family RNA polymerase sigma factor [Actinobacteria bacterium]|nr:sigma-70 family RNA polymerase sigma factor [Actinomycetota bacterium]
MATVAQQPGLTPPPAALSVSRTESELMRLVARGDHDAFLVVYDRHARAALGVALRMVRSREAAEEIVQEAFLSLWRGAGSYNPARGSVRTFVLGIVRYRALDAIRRQAVRSREHTSDAGLEETHEAPEHTDLEAARREEAASVRAALKTLPQGQFRAIELAFFAGLSHSEIARQLSMPVGTVKGRIRLGIDKLRGELRGMTDTTYTTTIEICPTPARNT